MDSPMYKMMERILHNESRYILNWMAVASKHLWRFADALKLPAEQIQVPLHPSLTAVGHPWSDRRRPPSHPLSAVDNRTAQTYLNLRSIDNVQVLWALQRLASVFFGPRPAHSSKTAWKNISWLDEKFIGNICVSLRNVSSFFPSPRQFRFSGNFHCL